MIADPQALDAPAILLPSQRRKRQREAEVIVPPEPLLGVPEDFLEYGEEYGWVQDKMTSDYGPFRPNSHQLIVKAEIEKAHAEGRPALIIVLKARQLGITTFVYQYFLHRALRLAGRNCLLVVQDQVNKSQIHDDKLREQFKHLPNDFAGSSESNRQRLVLENGSRFVVDISTGMQLSAKKAERGQVASERKGRGGTYQMVHCSEVAFWVGANNTLSAINEMNHPIPGNIRILESTANGKGGKFYETWDNACKGLNDYVPLFFSWKDDPGSRMKPAPDFERTPFEKDLAARHKLDDWQLQWRRYKIANDNLGDERKFRQENPLTPDEAFLITGNCWFDADNLQKYKDAAPDPLWKGELVDEDRQVKLHEKASGFLSIYKMPERGRAYAIGADVGEGTEDGAYSCAQVCDRDTFEQVATWHGRIDTDLFAYELVKLGLLYNTALIACERNGPGLSTVIELGKTTYPDEKIYKSKKLEMQNNRMTESQEPGWATTPYGTRRVLCATGKAIVRDFRVKINDRTTLGEMETFVDAGDGKPAAASGCYDDAVMAYLIMAQVARERLLDYDE